ncbi:MAG: hypothetical protein J5725_12510 [Bacteroidales bacterium]|nr:hypothetical protein [Bacteroidales bacterium]
MKEVRLTMEVEMAISIIEAYKADLTSSASNQLFSDIEAFDLALQALREYRVSGEWISDSEKSWVLRCSICKKEAYFDDYEGEYLRSTYCPHCGAKMGQQK